MEKTNKNEKSSSSNNPRHSVWDCGSSLYDSFELKSFEKQLGAAISSRTLSMPHLSDRRLSPLPNKKATSSNKISRSLHRLLRSVFKPRNKDLFGENPSTEERFCIVYERSTSLSTVRRFGGLSPETRSPIRRTVSERFTDLASIGAC